MFDISWSELVILAIVALIFVGPKELPKFLAALGRYAGVIRRHANEFRQQFDQAMREAQLDEIKNEVEGVRESVVSTAREAERSVSAETEGAKREIEAAATAKLAPDAAAAPATVLEASSLPAPLPAPSESKS
ncbi:MAG TPA: Sec-independent protein translocase protein TatB [Hyphomicrobiaceae bacterium]|nr:Sec-independent protein translocase protein TatB [Hyphomicrobiaceae bacterium]